MRWNNRDLINVGQQTIGIEGFGGCTIEEYRGYLLKILDEIDRICKKNNIEYFLMYGTLIGAVRHGGFIPWDDDADITMTRDNFNKFKDCCQKELGEEFDLVTYNDEKEYGYTFPRIRLKNTTYIIRSEISRHGRNAGFFVDIIILDYVSDNKFKAFIQKRALIVLHRLVSPGFFQSELGLNPVENFLVKLSKLIFGRKRSIKFAEKIASSAKKETCSTVIADIFLPTVDYYYIYDRKHFDKSVSISFEGRTFPVPTQPIELLHKMYFKSYISNNILLEHIFEDEPQAINEKRLWYFNDIMYIPSDRSRNRHLEIVFDKNHGSEFYDKAYFSEFDKKKNDRCAVKERSFREKARKYLNVMNANENASRDACTFILLNEYLQKTINENPDVNILTYKQAVDFSDNIAKLGVYFDKELSFTELMYCMTAFKIAGRINDAKRFARRIEAEFPEKQVKREKDTLENMENTYYAIFENKTEFLEKYVQMNDYSLFSIVVKGVLLYTQEKYDEAQNKFRKCLDEDDSVFLAHYYLGLIALNHECNFDLAHQMFCEALDDTNYMPLLQMALDKIKEIENGKNKESVNC